MVDILSLLYAGVKNLQAENAELLSTLLQPYIASPVGPVGGATEQFTYWPLVSRVEIFAPIQLLSTGLVLIDLPGSGDVNAARNRVADDYIQQCDHLMLVSMATRSSDATASRGTRNIAGCGPF